MATLPLLLSAYLSKPSNVINVSKVYYYDKNLTLTQNMPGNLSFSENDFLLNTGLITVYNNLINYINLINPNDIPFYTPLSSLQYGDYFINPSVNNFQPTQIIQNSSSSNINNSKIINFVASVDSDDLNFGTVKPDYTNVLTNINNNLASLVSKNNQSEITQKLSDIFEYTLLNDSKISSMKAYTGNLFSADEIERMNVVSLLYKILTLLCNQNINWASSINSNMGIFKDIQKCIKYQVPANSSNDLNENLVNIKKYLSSINNKLSETVSNVDVPLLKEISLAISSLASANDNQAIKTLKDTISALELKVNVDNALLVDGTQEFRMRPFGKSYIDDEDESYS